jgi:translation elongation factor EF-4
LIMVGVSAHVGDTVTHPNTKIEPLPGFKPLQSMVFAGVFPLDATDFQKLEEAIGRVRLIRIICEDLGMILITPVVVIS